MSLENHPNFHALKFVSEVITILNSKISDTSQVEHLVSQYHLCFRDNKLKKLRPNIKNEVEKFIKDSRNLKDELLRSVVVEFVVEIEEIVDAWVNFNILEL